MAKPKKTAANTSLSNSKAMPAASVAALMGFTHGLLLSGGFGNLGKLKGPMVRLELIHLMV